MHHITCFRPIRIGRPFSAAIKLNDANEVSFDFPERDGDDGEVPDFTGQEPLGACPKCGSRVFESTQAYVCEKAVGLEKTCDFRSGRVILQRPVERPQMQKLLATGKTDLLAFVSARTKRGFSAFLVRQPDGKIGFEFEAKDGAKGKRGARGGTALRVLGAHPKDKRPVELHAGRYGPYVKHGTINATLPDKDRADDLTLDEALALLDAKSGKASGGRTAKAPAKTAAKTAAKAAAKTAPTAKAKALAKAKKAPAGVAETTVAANPASAARGKTIKPAAAAKTARKTTRSAKK